jgi:hypothetical protein
MFSFKETAEKAAAEFGLSMKDDPTLWPEGSTPTLAVVTKACNDTAIECARSAMSRGLGKIAETVATEFDVAIAEDGPLADLETVLNEHLYDGPDIDLSAVLAAPDWQARVEATREAFGVAVQSYDVPARSAEEVALYVELDPRLSKLGIVSGSKPDVPQSLLVNQGGDEWDEPDAEVKDEPDAVDPWADEQADKLDRIVNPGGVLPPARERGKPSPGKARRTKAEIAEDEAADRADQAAAFKDAVEGPAEAETTAWDDEPASEAPAPALDAGWDDAEPAATAANLPGLASAAGIADGEMAALLGMSKGYYSQVRNGKRPWPGLKPDQVQRLRAELAGRREAIDAVEAALSTADVLKPEGA